jgi:hypothetical protein
VDLVTAPVQSVRYNKLLLLELFLLLFLIVFFLLEFFIVLNE